MGTQARYTYCYSGLDCTGTARSLGSRAYYSGFVVATYCRSAGLCSGSSGANLPESDATFSGDPVCLSCCAGSHQPVALLYYCDGYSPVRYAGPACTWTNQSEG